MSQLKSLRLVQTLIVQQVQIFSSQLHTQGPTLHMTGPKAKNCFGPFHHKKNVTILNKPKNVIFLQRVFFFCDPLNWVDPRHEPSPPMPRAGPVNKSPNDIDFMFDPWTIV